MKIKIARKVLYRTEERSGGVVRKTDCRIEMKFNADLKKVQSDRRNIARTSENLK